MRSPLTYVKNATFLLFILLSTTTVAKDHTIGILVFDDVLTSDITAPLEVFGIASKQSWFNDYDVITINVGNKPSITTEEGLTLTVDDHISNQPKVDILLVPSSYDMQPLLNNPSLISYLKTTASHADWLASNCSGSFLLAEAGLLNGLKATTWSGGESELARAYPKVDVQVDQNVVIDKNVITSNGSLVSYQAAFTLLAQLTSEKNVNKVKETLQLERFLTQI